MLFSYCGAKSVQKLISSENKVNMKYTEKPATTGFYDSMLLQAFTMPPSQCVYMLTCVCTQCVRVTHTHTHTHTHMFPHVLYYLRNW